MPRAKALLYRPDLSSARLFHPKKEYRNIDWNDFPEVLSAFKKQIYAWYVTPASILSKRSPHYSFASLAVTCTLIDCLSQFYYGKPIGTRKTFIRFAKLHLTGLADPFSVGIPIKKAKRIDTLKNGAQVLYFGIRCGILHEAHPQLFSVISGTGQACRYVESGLTEYSKNGHHYFACPTVIFDPHYILSDLRRFLKNYILRLSDNDSSNDKLRRRFRRKFKQSYGINLN